MDTKQFYFVLPYTIPHYLAEVTREPAPPVDHPEFIKAEEEVASRTKALLENNGKQSVNSFHKRLGKIMWDKCGMARSKSGTSRWYRTSENARVPSQQKDC